MGALRKGSSGDGRETHRCEKESELESLGHPVSISLFQFRPSHLLLIVIGTVRVHRRRKFLQRFEVGQRVVIFHHRKVLHHFRIHLIR